MQLITTLLFQSHVNVVLVVVRNIVFVAFLRDNDSSHTHTHQRRFLCVTSVCHFHVGITEATRHRESVLASIASLVLQRYRTENTTPAVYEYFLLKVYLEYFL